jgi:hypothetical protein
MCTTVLQREGLLTSIGFWTDAAAAEMRSSPAFLIADRRVTSCTATR